MQPTAMLPKLSETTQTITFSDDDDSNVTAEVYATNVLVSTNAGAHSHGSSRVKLKSLVDYNWEPRFYPGQLLAVHLSGKFLAYCIKAPNPTNPGTWHGMVRVVYNPEPGTDRRALIKGMKGEVQDLSFAHIMSQVILACIDEQGNFYVHEIEVTDSGLRCTLISEVRSETATAPLPGTTHRVVWCPYIPDEDDDSPDDDVAKLLLTTHGSIARMWNVSSLGSGAVGAVTGAGVTAGREHTAHIVDAAFSPDGTALATASADGYVMFFQVYTVGEGSPRCLHKWQPHGGKPLSCLFFLDNHKHLNTDVQFWKFAVTGAENNTVMKIWSCKSWTCLQTITFGSGLASETAGFGLKAMLDTSASYLLLSDFSSRSLFVLSMARDKDDTMAYCKSISEFLLPYPVLSFCIVDAEEDQTKCESGCDDPFHRNGSAVGVGDSPDDFDNDEGVAEAGAEASDLFGGGLRVRLRLFIVQPKGLQEGELTYTLPQSPHTVNPTADLLHGLNELSLEKRSPSPSGACGALLVGHATHSAPELPQLNLMTPDAFSSPGKRDDDDPPLSNTPDVSKSRTSNSVCDEVRESGEGKVTSGGSSPSREVRDIMAHSDRDYLNHMEEDEANGTPVEEGVGVEVEEEGVNGEVYPEAGAADESAAHDVFPPPEKPPPPPAALIIPSTETSWPQISLAQITEANQRKASSDKSSVHSHNNSLNVSANATTTVAATVNSEEVRVSGLSAADKARLEALEHKLDKLCDLVSAQSREVRLLRGEGGGRALVEEALLQHSRRTTAAIETALNDGWERIARVGEAASARAASAAGVGAARALEPLATALHHELAAKLSATDHLLRDNIDKLATNKTVMERLSTSIAKSLSEMVRESFRAALVESVVPAMEKAHAQIFRQINHAFQTGTKEFAAHTEAAARAAAERGGASAAASLKAALERHTEALNAASPPHAVLASTLKDVAHSVLEKELQWWRSEARSVMSQIASRAHSPHPAPSHASHASAIDRQMQVAQIQSLMSGGDMNGAFQLALSASDLQLVVAACRAAEPARVFAPPCKLKQHVLLSLVQQLAADMTTDTLLKHRYLEEAVMNLDPTNPVTREHLPVVIRELQKQIVAFINSNPGHALTRQFKMLLMATDSLVKTSV